MFPSGWDFACRHWACLEVADTGCGIAPEYMENLFDPFFSTKFPGRGLGLASVLGIVSACGGAVGVSSSRDQGSVFRVFLPIEKQTVAAGTEAAC